MANFKLFSLNNGIASEIKNQQSYFDRERQLQILVEQNMYSFFAVNFIKSEWAITEGRMDSVGLDENCSLVIFEYKKKENENIINQALFYLDWLKDHKGDFKDIVRDKLGDDKANNIDWNNPYVVCLASEFNKYDEHAVKQMQSNIKLVKYKKYDNLIAFEQTYDGINNGTYINRVLTSSNNDSVDTENRNNSNDFSICLDKMKTDQYMIELFDDICSYIENLGDLEKVELKKYLAYKKITNIICVTIKPTAKLIHLYLSLNTSDVEIKNYIDTRHVLRNVANIGHYGTGDLELTISSRDDFENNKDLIDLAYNNN